MAVATVNNVVTDGNNTGATLTISAYTPSTGDDAKLIVMHGNEGSGGADPDTIKFDGTDLTIIDSDAEGINNCSMWYLDSPGTSAGDIVLTWGSFTGSKLAVATTLLGAASGAPEANATSTSTTSPISTNITTLTNNALILSALSAGVTNVLTQGTGETEHADFSQGTHRGGFSSKEDVVAGSESMAWSQSSPNRLVHVIASIAPPAAAVVGINLVMAPYIPA